MKPDNVSERACYEIRRGFNTCSLLGEQLWSKKPHVRKPQHYARPAGKLLAQMHRSGLVVHREWVEGQRHGQEWRLTERGCAALAAYTPVQKGTG